MSKINDGGPAFPIPEAGYEYFGVQDGMSLRDYIASQALNGMLAHATRYRPYEKDRGLHWHEAIAFEAYELADAMLSARSNRGEEDNG